MLYTINNHPKERRSRDPRIPKTNIDLSIPMDFQIPFVRTSLSKHNPFHRYESEEFQLASKTEHEGKYNPFKTVLTRAKGFFRILHTYLANKAWLNTSISQKLRPPISLGHTIFSTWASVFSLLRSTHPTKNVHKVWEDQNTNLSKDKTSSWHLLWELGPHFWLAPPWPKWRNFFPFILVKPFGHDLLWPESRNYFIYLAY